MEFEFSAAMFPVIAIPDIVVLFVLCLSLHVFFLLQVEAATTETHFAYIGFSSFGVVDIKGCKFI